MGVRVRLPSAAPRRSKVRFAPTSFYACGKKDVIRPLPCSSFPTATRCAGLAVGGPPCGRLLYARKRHIACDELFHFTAKLIARSLKLLLASKPDPLSLGFGLGPPLRGGFFLSQKNIDFNRLFQLAASVISLAASFFLSLQNLLLRSPGFS